MVCKVFSIASFKTEAGKLYHIPMKIKEHVISMHLKWLFWLMNSNQIEKYACSMLKLASFGFVKMFTYINLSIYLPYNIVPYILF